ncbi:hypothetical protein N7490_003959 [Penicillium lividum]|nr:hypothetical protein N7490_003959 [Penicillium lividum]
MTNGQQDMVSYTADNQNGEHFFCPVCGTGIMANNHVTVGKSSLAVNARALLDVNPFTLDVEVLVPSDATASTSSFYEPPKVSGDGLKIYTGGCACGVITLAVKTKPLSEVEIKEDNCSICQRVGHHF